MTQNKKNVIKTYTNPVTGKFAVGNPGGARPKKEFSMTNAFREVLSEKDPREKIEKYKVIINKAISMATRGDNDMIKYIVNRLEGMPSGSQPIVPIQINQPLDMKLVEQEAVELLKKLGYKVEK